MGVIGVEDEIRRLLKEKKPKEIIEMGYARSTVYYVAKKLEEEEQRKGLLNVVRQLIHRKKGSLELAMGRLVFEALTENNHLKVIDRVCRAYQMLNNDEKQVLLSKEELEELKRICTVNTALLNACKVRKTDLTVYHVLIPIPCSKIPEYMKFLEVDPEHTRYIGWHEEGVVKPKSRSRSEWLKDRLFLNITDFSYHALVSYFVGYALPRVMKALRRLIDVVDPYTFREVVLGGGSMDKGGREDKLHKA